MESSTTSTTAKSLVPAQTLALMTEIISYPVLLQHEETFTSTTSNTNTNDNDISTSTPSAQLYDVSSWILYLSEIDSLLEQLTDAIQNLHKSKRNKGPLTLSTIHVGGRSIPCQHLDLIHCVELLCKGRNMICERALSLLPGSYKLWKCYLDFRSSDCFMTSTFFLLQPPQSQLQSENDNDQHKNSIANNKSYQLTSSPTSTKYKTTISAYERSLVRMNKYPRIWLSYIHYTIKHNPQPNISTIRTLFNRSLLALPATQHDVIWNEYLCWILNDIPPIGLMVGRGKNIDGPLVKEIRRCGTIGMKMNVSSNDNDDDDDDDEEKEDHNHKENDIPPETILRILRRYAHYYNPTARELLASKATQLHRYGEAATLYCDILNDVDFLSGQGTTRHELWMKLANVCTEHPEDSRDAGVDFEGIVRAVLKPPLSRGDDDKGGSGSGSGSSGFGWDIFEKEHKKKNTTTNNEEGGGGGGDDDNNNNKHQEKEQEKSKKQKVIDQRNQLQASLGEMEGTLWTKLAQYHIRMGEFELARSIYEEAMENVMRVRDFSLIFDGYIKFEEGVIEAMMEMMNEEDSDDENEDENDNGDGSNGVVVDGTKEGKSNQEDEEDLDIILGVTAVKRNTTGNNNDDDDDEDENISADIELALARAENLMSRRPLLLNYVLLRQNPHNVGEWLRRADLFMKLNQLSQAIASLEESVTVVQSKYAVNGSPSELYKRLAYLHETKLDNLQEARLVFQRICCNSTEYMFRESDDLAQCYTAWVEMELRVENWDEALSIARRSVAHVPAKISTKVTRGLSRSMRLWNLLLDLEESLGTMQTTKDAYNRLLEIKVATPAHVMNFASYLIEKKYFEECFTAYERGLDLFSFPHPGAKLLWKDYLIAFHKRYGGTKIHRMRELFDRCLESCPAVDASEFFILYGKFEEDFGLTKRALGVYERMCTTVPVEEKYTSYQLYIAKTIKYLGITATRPIYENAISALEDNTAAEICCEFAKMESSLQEIDRARTAFTYGAQLADPRRNPEYWGEWHAFEVSHGNEETFREMLRVKRGVKAAFSTVNYNAAEMGATAPQQESLSNEEAMKMIAAREGIETNDKGNMGGFVQGKRTAEMSDLDEVEKRAAKLRKVTSSFVAASANKEKEASDEEIDIDDEEDDDEDVDGEGEDFVHNVKTKVVPSAVFGGLATQANETTTQ